MGLIVPPPGLHGFLLLFVSVLKHKWSHLELGYDSLRQHGIFISSSAHLMSRSHVGVGVRWGESATRFRVHGSNCSLIVVSVKHGSSSCGLLLYILLIVAVLKDQSHSCFIGCNRRLWRYLGTEMERWDSATASSARILGCGRGRLRHFYKCCASPEKIDWQLH